MTCVTAGPDATAKAARLQREQGSVWILAPAAVLILVVLAAIAVDSAVIFLGQRQLANAAASAATDSAGGISRSSFYAGGGQVTIDPTRATQLAIESLAAQNLTSVQIIPADTQVSVLGNQVCVSLTGKVDPIFGRAFSSSALSTTVHATSVATAAGLSGTSVAPAALCH